MQKADTEINPYRLFDCPLAPVAKRCGFLLALFCEPKVTGIRLPSMTIEACKDLLFKSLFFIL